MRIISNDGSLVHWAKKIESELSSYGDDWYLPIHSELITRFLQSKMIFVNRNLNPYNLGNMLAAVCEGDDYNPRLPITRNFCGYSRSLTGDTGPFGRMCVWQLPPHKELLPHFDAFDYHHNIIRNIFIVSDHSSDESRIDIGGHDVEFEQGTLFQFSPSTEKHAFINSKDTPFYFLGYDFWIPAKLSECLSKFDNLEEIINNHDRLTQYGSKYHKYGSEH